MSIPIATAVSESEARLEALRRSGLLDAAPEEVFDRFTRLVVQILDVPVSTVTLLDADRQFYLSQVGLPEPLASARETPLEYSVCHQVLVTGGQLVVSDARTHELLATHKAVTEFGVVGYLGIPLATREGHTLGTLCALTDEPHDWSDREVATMNELASFLVAEVELRLLAQDLIEAQMESERARAERHDIMQMIVHDLRSPLTALSLSFGLLSEADLDEGSREIVEEGLSSTSSLIAMVSSLLDVSKSEAGAMTLHASNFSVDTLLDEVMAQARPLARNADVRLEVDVDRPTWDLWGDKDMLRRVLVNLIQNAVQHCDAASGLVRIGIHQLGDATRLTVQDNGCGIPEEDHERIFTKFAQAGSTPLRTHPSTGLGLAFVKMAAELHGSAVDLESAPGHGSTFSLCVPNQPELR